MNWSDGEVYFVLDDRVCLDFSDIFDMFVGFFVKVKFVKVFFCCFCWLNVLKLFYCLLKCCVCK